MPQKYRRKLNVSDFRFVIRFCITKLYGFCQKMLEDLRSDVVVSFLLSKSNLTEAQLDTILASDREGNLNVKRALRENGPVSKGAFVRTLRQADANIESSVYTLFLLSYLKQISSDKVAQLGRTARMLSQLREASPSRSDSARVIDAMQQFMRDFRGQKVIL